MEAPQTLGQRLREAMRSAGVKNRAIADAAGVHINTVSQWLNDRFPPSDDALEAIALVVKRSASWIRYGTPAFRLTVGAPMDEEFGTSYAVPRIARNLPFAVREYRDETRLRLTKGGASEEEVDEAMALLRSPEIFIYFSGGKLNEFNETDVLDGMRSIVENAIIPRLRKLGRRVP